MKLNLSRYGQYKKDIFEKLDFSFVAGQKLLDLGCGDGSDAEIFLNEYKLDVYGVDIYEHENLKKIKGLKFEKGGIFKIPFKDSTFDYVFLHDILHHLDEKGQRKSKHLAGLKELKRVCKKGGTIIIVEGNRYNPLFYPHMVKMLGHNHFRQSYFNEIVLHIFPGAKFKYFEVHLYPKRFISFWKAYEYIMENMIPKCFLSYNLAIIKK
jgi:ubiquinone/menaquinone biosynthesis C-methylase UbiE